MPEDSSELIGPYEQWAYCTGEPYMLGSSLKVKSRYTAVMAELPAGSARKIIGGASDGAGRAAGIRVPTLWGKGFEGDEPLFCPLVHVLPSPVERGVDEIRNIVAALSELRASSVGSPGAPERATPLTEGAEIRPMFGYSINTRIPEDSFNHSFKPDAIAARYIRKPEDGRRPVVIMAVIDDGIPLAHRNLRDHRNNSRVEFCWLQGADAAEEPKDQTVLFGREYTRDDIDALIAKFGGDEDALYQSTGAMKHPVFPGSSDNHFGTHGAHVIDAAAGHRHGSVLDTPPVGPDRDLDRVSVIAVQLPTPVTLDTVGFGKDAFVLSAFHYIFERAERIAKRYYGEKTTSLPLIINFSYGFTGGPHKGRERLERALRDLIRKRVAPGTPETATHLIMPSGNTFLSALNGTISKLQLKGEDAFEIPWRIQPNDHTSNYLEIWLPEGENPEGFSISIRNPSGFIGYQEERIELPKNPVRHADIKDSMQTAIGQFSLEFYGTGGKEGLWRLFIAIAPTEPDDPSRPAAEAGLWKIKLQNLSRITDNGKSIACRIQRDNDPFGYIRGARQSYFDDPLDIRFDDTGRRSTDENRDKAAFVHRFGTLNGLATHDAVTVVGGFIADSLRSAESTGRDQQGDNAGAGFVADPLPADYASAGVETSPPGAGSVHYSAPSETSRILGGIVAGGMRSGSVFRLSGTSTAAPQVSRALAIEYLVRAGKATRDRGPQPSTGELLEGKIHKFPVQAARIGQIGRKKLARLGTGLLLPKHHRS